jgi:hypothetical protein
LPSPGKQSWTCKRITALQCCKVLGRKSGLEKRTTALHELPGPGKPKPDMQKDNCIALLYAWSRQAKQEMQKNNCTYVLQGSERKAGPAKKTTALL